MTRDEKIVEQVVREVLRHAADMDFALPPPVNTRIIYSTVRRITGVDDPYYDAKRQFNKFALGLYDELAEKIYSSADPFAAAVHLAGAGNIIDLGVKTGVNAEHVHEAIDRALESPLDPREIETFRRAVADAKNILYLLDNSGEIVFDRLLIEQMPMHKITAAVRGKPIINDVLMEDAIETGVAALIRVIDNGADGPGTYLPDCSAEFRAEFERADLIISKGQGNYETLNELRNPVIFLLTAKCPVVAKDLGVPEGTLILKSQNLS